MIVRRYFVVEEQLIRRNLNWLSSTLVSDPLAWRSKKQAEEIQEFELRVSPRWQFSTSLVSDNLSWLKKVSPLLSQEELFSPSSHWQISTLTLAPIVLQLDWKPRQQPIPDPEIPTPPPSKWLLSTLQLAPSNDQLRWNIKWNRSEFEEILYLSKYWQPWMYSYTQPAATQLLTLPILRVGS